MFSSMYNQEGMTNNPNVEKEILNNPNGEMEILNVDHCKKRMATVKIYV